MMGVSTAWIDSASRGQPHLSLSTINGQTWSGGETSCVREGAVQSSGLTLLVYSGGSGPKLLEPEIEENAGSSTNLCSPHGYF